MTNRGGGTDNMRVFRREVLGPATIGRLCRGAEASALVCGNVVDDIDPTSDDDVSGVA